MAGDDARRAPGARRYTVYGDLAARETVALSSVLIAKGLPTARVPETASLVMALESRSGRERGPYLRTPEGFVLGGLHGMLDWIERIHPQPPLLPCTPVRRTCARLLELWIERWLPGWPRRSWSTLEGLGRHLATSGFLLGRTPRRPDWLLAAWLETEVLIHDHARAHLERNAARLVRLGDDLLEATPAASVDDVVPVSLLPVLEEIARDHLAFLEANHAALKDGSDRVWLDLGLGRRPLPVRIAWEARRMEMASELAALEPAARRDVRRVLEPVGAWHVLTLPRVLSELDAADPRSV